MTVHELRTPDGAIWVDDLGAVIDGCELGGVWVMPDTRSGRTFASGEPLFPWPNRLRDGRWTDGAVVRDLPITEPSRNTAIHGLLRDVQFAVETGADALTLRGRLRGRAGYPWTIDCELAFRLGPGQFESRATFTNRSDSPAPWAYGAHPYLCLPDPAAFVLAADRVWQTDAQLIPTHNEPVSAEFDRRTPNPLGSFELDHAFERRPGARIIASLLGAGVRLDCWADDAFGFTQVFTPPAVARLHAHGTAIAVEPMTAPADAFNSGIGLRHLAPSETASLAWGLDLIT